MKCSIKLLSSHNFSSTHLSNIRSQKNANVIQLSISFLSPYRYHCLDVLSYHKSFLFIVLLESLNIKFGY